MIRFLRKLFGLRHPELSRTQLAAKLDAALDLNYRFSCDLRRAVLHGYWRLDHPLSAVCPARWRTRHPRLTESEIEAQYQKIMLPEMQQLVVAAKGAVLELPQ